jgi:alanine racemase
MSLSRRSFLGAAAGGAVLPLLERAGAPLSQIPATRWLRSPGPGPADGYDPWLEVDPDALRANAREVARVTDGRPVLAVIKNNGYGLGLERTAVALDGAPEVVGLAVVKVEEAFRLVDAGVRKPVLLMTRASDREAEELVRQGVRLAPYTDDDPARLAALGRRLQSSIPVHLYLDTGMSRLGMPYHRARPWIVEMANREEIRIEGSFMGFTEERDFDLEQLRRFRALAQELRDEEGLPMGPLHAASSNHVTFLPQAYLDMVRPGLVLFGAHVAGGREAGTVALTPAMRLRARVIRMERLRKGDSVSYGRNYIADAPVWVATIPVGHSDGYPREAVQGCRILVGDRTYPVIGAVSASHCIVEVGSEREVEVGDVATLMGPDHPDIHPNEISEHTGRSVYDVLMHLSPALPAREWS